MVKKEKEYIGYLRKDGTIEFKSDVQVTKEIADAIMGLSLEDFGLLPEPQSSPKKSCETCCVMCVGTMPRSMCIDNDYAYWPDGPPEPTRDDVVVVSKERYEELIKLESTEIMYDYCTYCKKEVESIDVGFPISGSDFRCPICERTESDLYPDKMGLETRYRKKEPEQVKYKETRLSEYQLERLITWYLELEPDGIDEDDDEVDDIIDMKLEELQEESKGDE